MSAAAKRLSAAQKERIVRAAIAFAQPWMVDGKPHPVFRRHWYGLTATLVRACAAAERAAKPIKEKRRA